MMEEREILTMQNGTQAAELPEAAMPAEVIEVAEPPTSPRVDRLAISRQRTYTAELMKAHVALLEREVILSKNIDLFRLVNRHYYTLQSWHDANTGWRIQRGATVIRLVRQLSATTPGYIYDRLRDSGDFACLTWILWYAENRQLTGRGNDQQFLLSQLAEQIAEQSRSGNDGEAAFDFRRPADRYSIQRALQYLEELGALQLVDGQTKEWVEQAADADVLYEFTDVIRSLVSALNPQLLGMAAEHLNNEGQTLQSTLLSHMVGDLFPAATVRPLVRAWRSLLLGPALFRFDDPEAFAELLAHADEVASELLETFAWLLDIKRDYACIVRASGMSGGPVTSLTPFGTNDQIAMLMCGAIREQVTNAAWPRPDSYGCIHVTTEDMNALFYTVRERYGENWGNEARGKSSRSLLNDVYKKMRQAGLLRGPDSAGNVLILPTAARYSAVYEKAGQEAKAASKSKAKTVAAALPGWEDIGRG
jgi:uncharacterized protein (TIGR02678 family)